MGGNNLADYRRAKDLGLWEAAKRLNVTVSDLSSWEHERVIPNEMQIKMLAELYEVTEAQIKAALPGLEEAAKNKQKLKSFMETFVAVSVHAGKAGLGRGNGGRGSMPCPICGANLHYSVASVNGHIWAACATEDCVRFMQ